MFVTRFAPSPNGLLHLGHALSALIAFEAARRAGGRFLLRIEDIDQTRARPAFETAIFEDLAWLGLEWEEPVRRQSEHFATYAEALDRLKACGLVYPSHATRNEIAAAVAERERMTGRPHPRDPDGAPIFPGVDGDRSNPAAWRLRMDRALAEVGEELSWSEAEQGRILAQPALWGDVILARKEFPSSYHLSVVVDDALQGVTHVIRGRDLFHATSVHRLLQRLLGLPEPLYHHHRLILSEDGKKLSKSEGAKSLRQLRAEGVASQDIRNMVLELAGDAPAR